MITLVFKSWRARSVKLSGEIAFEIYFVLSGEENPPT